MTAWGKKSKAGGLQASPSRSCCPDMVEPCLDGVLQGELSRREAVDEASNECSQHGTHTLRADRRL